MNKENAARATSLLLCLAVWAFIFSNSLQGGPDSSARSDAVLAVVNHLITEVGGDPLQSWMIRKAAHFTEFAALGFSLTLAMWVWMPGLPIRRRIPLAFAVGAASAACDEAIQLFSEGRSAQLTDVLLDSSGVLAGVLVTAALLLCLGRRQEARRGGDLAA